uniref:Uncharacterized protein n=1 Tax=Rhizophora mucronata TaxID=61149 RepID=A0A2P2JKN9_RHIMU
MNFACRNANVLNNIWTVAPASDTWIFAGELFLQVSDS